MAGLIALAAVLSIPAVAQGEGEEGDDSSFGIFPVETHGFYEIRTGCRVRKDPYEKDMSVMESRLQLDLSSYPEWGVPEGEGRCIRGPGRGAGGL
jgi:hypothetical protein